MSNKIDKNASKKKKILKVIGFIFLPLGLLFLIFGFSNFELFFLSFLGMPMLFIGSSCLMFAYQGSIARYNASQTAPVLKDTINYLADETKDTIVNVSNEIKNKQVKCHKCNHENDYNANFCDNCGSKLYKICSNCNEKNDADASFCKSCGKEL